MSEQTYDGCETPNKSMDKRCKWCMFTPESDACKSWRLKTDAVAYSDEVGT